MHWGRGAYGLVKPNAVMPTLRKVSEDDREAPGAFGRKVRDRIRTQRLEGVRERGAGHVNDCAEVRQLND